jgi:hypothetical protein
LDAELLNRQYLECRISEHIYYEIVEPIQRKNLLKRDNRFHVEFLFLLLNRCRENIISAREVVHAKYPLEVADQFCNQVQPLLDIVSKKYDEIMLALKAIEDKFSSIVKDKISKYFDAESFKEK